MTKNMKMSFRRNLLSFANKFANGIFGCRSKEMRCMKDYKHIGSFRRNLLSFATNIVNGKFGCKTREMR
jgi:hypothetical protein